MRRWLLRILAFLLLGAIVNVAVAWGCAVWATNVCGKQSLSMPTGGDLQWFAPVPDDWPTTPRSVGIARCPGITVWGASFVGFVQVGTATGVPSRAMYAHRLIEWGSERTGWLDHGIPIWRRLTLDNASWRSLPLRPIWPGFAINTVFYAVILWLLFAGPFVIRRWRRIRRGLCPKCAYDLRGATGGVCPECGSIVAS